MQKTTQATVRNRGASVFRILFGLAFLGLGIYRHSVEGAPPDAGLFSIGIGLLFFVYGLYAFFVGNKVQIQTPAQNATSTDRLGQILKMKNEGLITEQEFEAKRQEILKDL
jgi:hypothetical protein